MFRSSKKRPLRGLFYAFSLPVTGRLQGTSGTFQFFFSAHFYRAEKNILCLYFRSCRCGFCERRLSFNVSFLLSLSSVFIATLPDDGRIYFDPSLRTKGLQFFWARSDNIDDSSDQSGDAGSWQINDLEVWDGMPNEVVDPHPPGNVQRQFNCRVGGASVS